MFQFGNQVEFRVDRRHLLFLAMGAILWTFLTFFLGLWAASERGKRPIERGLRLLGWLDRQRAEETPLPTLASSHVRPSSKTHPSHVDSSPPLPTRRRVQQRQRPPNVRPQRALNAPLPRRQAPPPALPKRLNPPDARKISLEKRQLQEKKKRLQRFRMVPWARARYTMQIRFSSDFKTLRRIQKRLTKRGYPTPTLTREVFRKKRYFRLTLGAFRTKQQAQTYLRLFQQFERTSATVHKIR